MGKQSHSSTRIPLVLISILFVALFEVGAFAASDARNGAPLDAVMKIMRKESDLNYNQFAIYLESPDEEPIVVTAKHGVFDETLKEAPLDQLILKTNREIYTFALVDAQNETSSDRGVLENVDGVVPLKAKPEMNDDHDICIFHLARPLPGVEPLKICAEKPRANDQTKTATFQKLTPSKVSDPEFIYQGNRYLQISNDNLSFTNGFSGAPILRESGNQVLAIVVMVENNLRDIDAHGNKIVRGKTALGVYLHDVFGSAKPRDAEEPSSVASEGATESLRR